MHDDLLGVLVRHLRDEREKAVPERERIAGVQAPVGELRHAVERQAVEVEELPRTREVEEPVSLHGRSCDPHDEADHRTPEERDRARRHTLRLGPATPGAESQSRERDDHEDDERQRERRAEREGHGERGKDDGERPGERRRHAAHAEGACEQPAWRQHDRSGEGELEVEEDHARRPTRVAASPEASQAAPSR